MVASLPIPDVSKVASVSVTVASQDEPHAALRVEGDAAERIRSYLGAAQMAEAPTSLIRNVSIHWAHVDSVFVTVEAALDTSVLPKGVRPVLPLLLESLFKLPVMLENGTVIPAEEVIEALQRDTADYGSSVGKGGRSFMPGRYGGCAFVYVKTEAKDFATGVEWLKRILYQTVLDPFILKIQAQKLLSEIPEHKRDGGTMAKVLMDEILFGSSSTNHAAMNIMRQQKYLEQFMHSVETGLHMEETMEALEVTRRIIADALSMRIHVATDLLKLGAPYQTLSSMFPQADDMDDDDFSRAALTEGWLTNVTLLRASSHVKHQPSRQVLGLSSVENSDLQQTTAGLLSNDPELPAVLVAIEYLTALEGDFWCRIRGLGLAYGSTLTNIAEMGVLKFALHRATDPVAAQKAAAEIVAEYCRGEKDLNERALEGSKSSLIYEIVEGSDTRSAAAQQSWDHVFAGKPMGWEKQMMSKIMAVTKDEALTAMRKHLMPVFDLSKAALVVVSPTSKAESIANTYNATLLQEDKLSERFGNLIA
eukprot:gnl/TRDRNA2_/TRDRNA2_170539_c1_seq3.p1 gnl/TRDRNA2_/TRDRNA2_170539_c1~~gnl/TRDRNA2_/TRDRNA2_170539_c1_seq3.p1  ORF type:complete len:535 (+),score=82.50 gnl/TRDRNA2_/TRDRNA2_170539_c1_seq3:165-1769(+)